MEGRPDDVHSIQLMVRAATGEIVQPGRNMAVLLP